MQRNKIIKKLITNYFSNLNWASITIIFNAKIKLK